MEIEKIKILRVVIGLNQGGVQQGVLNLCRGLDKNRFDIIVCAIENGGTIGKEIQATGVKVIVLSHKRNPLKTIFSLLKILRKHQIDIAHPSSYHPSLYTRIAAFLAKTPIILSYEHVVFDRNRKQRALLNKILEPITDSFTTVGQSVAEQVINWYGYPQHKVKVIHNGVDTQRFYPANNKTLAKHSLGLEPNKLVIGMICRLDEEKGHRFFFQAIKKLKTQYDIQWLVVGTGRAESKIYAQAKEFLVEQDINFLGFRRDVPELLRAIDIYVLPTLQEGFPNSLLEAMAAGCAVTASNFSGNLEVASHMHNALIHQMADVSSLKNSLETLINSPELCQRLGSQARKDVINNFSLVTYAEKMMSLYETLWTKKIK